MPEAGSKEFKQLIQTVETPFRYEGIEFEKENPVNYYIDNMLRRTLAHQFGYTGKVWRPISITSSGAQKMSPQGGSYENYLYTSYSSETSTSEYDFGLTGDLIIINLTAGNLQVRIDNGSGVYGAYIPLQTYQPYAVPLQTQKVGFIAVDADFTLTLLY